MPSKPLVRDLFQKIGVVVDLQRPSRIAGPWTRKLLSGEAERHDAGGAIATIRPGNGCHLWSTLTYAGRAANHDAAKKCADEQLRIEGYALVNVPGGCTIESDEPKKLRVYREG